MATDARGVVAITGATGFLGRHLVRALAKDGWRPRVLVRRDPVHVFWRDLEVEIVTGDLGTPGALDRLANGAEVFIHVAGLIKATTLEGFNRVNQEGARAAAQAAKAAGRPLHPGLQPRGAGAFALELRRQQARGRGRRAHCRPHAP